MFLLFLSFLLANPIRVHAETTVDISLIGDYFDQEDNLEVRIETVPREETGLKVRPRIDPDQTLFTYAGEAIFSLGSFWTDLPSVPNHLTLHTPIPFDNANIWFEVQDTKTGKLYETPKKQVFGRKFVESYTADLNKNLFKW